MQIEAAEIHVHAAHHAEHVVADIAFCMDKTGLIFINFHACAQKGRIIGTGQPENGRLVRDPRRDDAHVHAPLRRLAEGVSHHVVHDQIGGENIDIIPGLMKDIQIYVFRDRFIIQRRIGVGLHQPGSAEGLRMPHMGAEAADIRILLPEGVPHFQEHHGKAPDSLPLQPDSRILPVAEADDLIDIFIRQIDPAGIARMAVDHQDLPVVPVVHDQRKDRHHRVEGHAFDARLFQPGVISRGKPGDAAHVVVDHADLHALSGLLLQHLQDAFPHLSFRNDEVFQKNEMPRAFQILHHVREHFLARGIISDLRIRIGGQVAHLSHIAEGFRRAGAFLLQPGRKLADPLLLFQAGPVLLMLGVQPVAQLSRGLLVSGKQIKQAAEQRQRHDEHDPADLIGGVVVLSDNI